MSSLNFELKNENNQLVSVNGQSNSFRLPIKEIQIFYSVNPKDNLKTENFS